MLIEGLSNTGKSKFLKKLTEIFPCEKFIPLRGTHFEADYGKIASYDKTKYKASFITINEAAYEDHFENGYLGETK